MQIKVLDHGYCDLVETWGSDESIISAARMSTNKGFQGWGPVTCPGCKDSPVAGSVWQKMTIDDGMGTEVECPTCKGRGEVAGDEKLLRYLWEHKHHTPFEMAGMVIEVQAPIMVFREWHRHRTQSYNEMSGRYTELPDLYYIPSTARLEAGKQSTNNKQASADGFSTFEAIDLAFAMLDATQYCRNTYEALLKKGVARELARLILPVNQYSRMRASANLRNWLAFLELRMAEGAQWEIREYSKVVGSLVKEHFPRTYQLFAEAH